MHPYAFSHVVELAQRLDGRVLVYDLEGTTFRGRPNFGLTEVGCASISPDGSFSMFGSLINPERAIDPKVVELTGITPDMVRDKETWGKRYAEFFRRMAAGEAWVTGFNNETFDNPAVREMNARYGQPFERFEKTFDVRKLHKALSGAKTQAGTLSVIAAMYDVNARGDLHRAGADVVLTLELLDAILAKYGLDAAVKAILEKQGAQPDTQTGGQPKPSPSAPPARSRAPSSDALIHYLREKASVTLEEVAQALSKELRTVSFEVGKAIDDRAINPEVFARPETQAFLSDSLARLTPALAAQGKLKPIYDHVNAASPIGEVDYVQLRIGLLKAGLSWSTLKPR